VWGVWGGSFSPLRPRAPAEEKAAALLNKENAVAKANQALADAKSAVSQEVETAHVEQQVTSKGVR
jgi:hypothetical protein